MTQIKICPECQTEYYPHIERCADCDAILLSPEENNVVKTEKAQPRDNGLENPVAVREGSLQWLDELFKVLIDSGIPCVVNDEAGCNQGGCGPKYRLLVASQNAAMANERIEEYCMEMHPEIKASNELISQGKCPACSRQVGPDTVECPDCGLTLLIIEKEDAGE